MKKRLENIIERFQDSQTSLESYQAISDFVEIIINIPEFIKQVEKEGEIIYNAKIALNNDKGDFSKEHNKKRTIKDKALHLLDPIFPLRNLHDVYQGIKTENILDNSDWLFHYFSPDEPMEEYDKNEYQSFIDKLYKKVIPFLEVKKQEKDIKKTTKTTNQPKNKIVDNEVRKALKFKEDTRWEDIELKFKNEFIVELRSNNRKYESDYEKMGFADKRKNTEDEAKSKGSWSLLRLFSAYDNVFDYDKLTLREKSKFKKTKQQLSELLKKYFQIAEDPIAYNKESGTYKMKMKLIPDETFREQYEDRDIFDQQI